MVDLTPDQDKLELNRLKRENEILIHETRVLRRMLMDVIKLAFESGRKQEG